MRQSIHISFSSSVTTFLRLQWGASTALMMAAKLGDCEMIDILLRHGANINAKNQVICLKDPAALGFGGFV